MLLFYEMIQNNGMICLLRYRKPVGGCTLYYTTDDRGCGKSTTTPSTV